MTYYELRSPQIYVQGVDALRALKRYLYPLGDCYLILLGCGPIKDAVGKKVKKSFEAPMTAFSLSDNYRAGYTVMTAERFQRENKIVRYHFSDVEGQKATHKNVEGVIAQIRKSGANVVVAIGGGSVMDIARIAGEYGGVEVVLCPTSVATNAASGAGAVEYETDGSIKCVHQLVQYPRVVISDVAEILKAPPITLAAGLGDCLGTYYESEYRMRRGQWDKRHIDKVLDGLCNQKRTIFDKGIEAYAAMRAGVANRELESVVALINYKSGAETQTSTSNIAHLISEMLLYFEESRHVLHGLTVGFGILPLLMIENQPDEELRKNIVFLRQLGIPLTLEELGLGERSKQSLLNAAQRVMDGPQNKIYQVEQSAEELCAAIFETQRFIRKTQN